MTHGKGLPKSQQKNNILMHGHREEDMNAQKLIEQGYRVTSRKYCLISRIDREDWHSLNGVNHLPRDGSAQDQYRRVYSKDTLTVSKQVAAAIPNSNNDTVGFIPI